MKTLFRITPIILFACALLGGLLFLVYKTQALDPSLTQQTDNSLQVFEEIDTKLHLDVLRSYMGIQQNYDELATALPKQAQNKQSFQALSTQLQLPELDSGSTRLQGLLKDKNNLVENFKTHHSILRNALYALPGQLNGLRDALNRLQQEALDETGQLVYRVSYSNLQSDIYLLAEELLSLVAFSREETLATAEELITRLENPTDPHPEEIQALLPTYLNTGKIILERWRKVNTLLTSMSSSSSNINSQLGVMHNQLNSTFNAQVQEKDTWRSVLVAYCAGLLLLLSFLGWRLWKSFRALDIANASLEQRVEERTHELNTAMTELKESQLQLIQSEKMASLGQMVAGVAHEINTPLAYVKGSMEIVNSRMNDVDSLLNETTSMMHLMTTEPDEGENNEEELGQRFANVQEITSAFVETEAVDEMRGLVDDGLHGIGQISEIVSNLKDFSRLDRARMDQFDVNDGIESTLKIAQNVVKQRHIEKILGAVPVIECSPSQINQVLLNLITNACQATRKEDGRVTLVTRNADNNDGVIIEISDNGKGISKVELQKIFDPFFTTKPVGEGTGLGLSIVQRIIQEHNGTIDVQSSVGMGTRFTIWLPYAQNTDEQPIMQEAA